LPAKIMIFIGS